MIAIWKENDNEDWGQKVLKVKEAVIQTILNRKRSHSEQEEEDTSQRSLLN